MRKGLRECDRISLQHSSKCQFSSKSQQKDCTLNGIRTHDLLRVKQMFCRLNYQGNLMIFIIFIKPGLSSLNTCFGLCQTSSNLFQTPQKKNVRAFVYYRLRYWFPLYICSIIFCAAACAIWQQWSCFLIFKQCPKNKACAYW